MLWVAQNKRPSPQFFQLCRDGSSWVEPARINTSYSKIQHSDAGEARTRGPSVSSQALYHCDPLTML